MDSITKIEGSTIQHGSHSNRIYLMHLRPGRTERLLDRLDDLAEDCGYTKIFAKIPADHWPVFDRRGYLLEAQIPRLFAGVVDGLFVSRFLASKRRRDSPDGRLGELLRGDESAEAGAPAAAAPGKAESEADIVHRCDAGEAREMSSLYRRVFATYPFPITEPDYIRETMAENVRYYCVRRQGAIAAAASAELDRQGCNAEMTDFATLPPWRGKGFAAALLRRMEKDLAATGIRTAYTIARADSYGMNLVFRRCGYSYAGFLANNTNIAGSIQSMTVWYRHLRKGASPTASQAEYA